MYGIVPELFLVHRCHYRNMSSATNLQFRFESLIHPVLIHNRYAYKNHDKIYLVFPVPTSAGLTLTGGITALKYPIVAGLIL